VDDWSEYWQFKCKQIAKKYKHTYLYQNGKVPLFERVGFDGVDNTVKIPKSYEEWKSLYKQ
jgi:hypothetical protein